MNDSLKLVNRLLNNVELIYRETVQNKIQQFLIIFMKNLFKNAILFIALCIAFSSLTACPTKNIADNAGNNQETANTSPSNDKKPSDYPLAPSAILQSEIKMLDGTTFKLEDKKGKVVLINMWATWCGPCRGEMPELVAMQEKYRDKGFEIIGLDTDRSETVEEINTFAGQMKLNYQLGYADDKLLAEFIKLSRMNGIPQSIVLDRENRLTGVFAGGGPGVVNKMKETVDKIVNQ